MVTMDRLLTIRTQILVRAGGTFLTGAVCRVAITGHEIMRSQGEPRMLRRQDDLRSPVVRILHVTRSLDPSGGGPPEGIRQFARAQLRSGQQLEIATLDAPGS